MLTPVCTTVCDVAIATKKQEVFSLFQQKPPCSDVCATVRALLGTLKSLRDIFFGLETQAIFTSVASTCKPAPPAPPPSVFPAPFNRACRDTLRRSVHSVRTRHGARSALPPVSTWVHTCIHHAEIES